MLYVVVMPLSKCSCWKIPAHFGIKFQIPRFIEYEYYVIVILKTIHFIAGTIDIYDLNNGCQKYMSCSYMHIEDLTKLTFHFFGSLMQHIICKWYKFMNKVCGTVRPLLLNQFCFDCEKTMFQVYRNNLYASSEHQLQYIIKFYCLLFIKKSMSGQSKFSSCCN